jgi:U3 small nucleolar RNA-associated protein 12
LVWDIKKSQMVGPQTLGALYSEQSHQLSMWHDTGHRAAVSCIASSSKGDVFAVGYADGSIRLWESATGNVLVRFNGHKKSVTALSFDTQGIRLASGSQDTDIIVWDIIAAEGIKR